MICIVTQQKPTQNCKPVFLRLKMYQLIFKSSPFAGVSALYIYAFLLANFTFICKYLVLFQKGYKTVHGVLKAEQDIID